MVFSWKSPSANPVKSRKVWIYRQGNYTRACQLINETDWNQVLNGDNVDAIAES